ncbi:MAG TPA: hypothetical protein VGR34_04730 [Candidatus Dormibacteraeota bacterium]|nr:hypothetical protein [Candidatus Dormibacteraeota bacterium]
MTTPECPSPKRLRGLVESLAVSSASCAPGREAGRDSELIVDSAAALAAAKVAVSFQYDYCTDINKLSRAEIRTGGRGTNEERGDACRRDGAREGAGIDHEGVYLDE